MRLWLFCGHVGGVRLTDDLLNRIKLMLAVQSLCKKYSASSIPQIKSISLAVRLNRGAFRDRQRT